MKILTSEMVFKGHPDKICDQISDAILDECLKQDKTSRVAIETLIKNNFIVIAGELTTKAKFDIKSVVCKVLYELGYKDAKDYKIIVKVTKQSPDIALGVDKEGAGDQGIMYGYACKESEELMPLPIVLARRIAMRMDELSSRLVDTFGKDGKCQVSVEYGDDDSVKRVSTIIVSQQTKKGVDRSFYEPFIIFECIKKAIPASLIDKDTKILINPTGEFVLGGSFADCGLTGRKIICDTYGGVAHHGGGAFSGKDLSKVDRSAAYYCRYVAKNLVAAGLAKKVEVQVAYAIGVAKPVAVNIDSFSTSKLSNDELKEIVLKFFNFSPRAIQAEFNEIKTPFKELARYGHMGRKDIDVPWERTNKAYVLKTYANEKYGSKLRLNS